jgi:Zn-dependent M28 family amino/carboxypeptidase
VALIQRGTCSYETKVMNAAAAGYEAVILFNEGQEGRRELMTGTLGAPAGIPVVFASFALGEELHGLTQRGAVRARVRTDTVAESRETANVIGETGEGSAERVVVVGAHLDSVREGPGINDNGSGAASVLALAERLRDRRGLRFAFWGAEELGLYGSRRYVASLRPGERRRIAGYVNLDMVGSPNGVRFVYGAGRVRAALEAALRARGLRFERTSVHGASDHAPFARAGIAVGGVYSGSQERKTARQARAYGGRAGRPLDPCYHRRCDTLARVDRRMLEQLAGAAGRALPMIL